MRDDLQENVHLRRMGIYCLLLTWCIALVSVRVMRTGSGYYLFLVWNLFLACIPAVIARMLRAAHDRRTSTLLQLLLVAAWLLFLPNSPYIVTDVVHLRPSTTLLYLFDIVLLLSFAGTGLLLGYTSLLDVHAIAAKRFGHKLGWVMASAALLLSGYGVYLGRVQRWNSWDVIANPSGLFNSIVACVLNPLEHFQVYALSALIGAALLVGYAAWRMTIGPWTLGESPPVAN